MSNTAETKPTISEVINQVTIALIDASATATAEEFALLISITEYYAQDGEELSDSARQAVREVLNIWA
tara:strand:+ start:37 stop:240 length:204 start_codon:yes stop_codon:yes gene_type:complete